MDFLGYSLGRLVHGFEDDSESSIDLTQELTDVPLFRWDYCVTFAGKHLTQTSGLFIQEVPM